MYTEPYDLYGSVRPGTGHTWAQLDSSLRSDPSSEE